MVKYHFKFIVTEDYGRLLFFLATTHLRLYSCTYEQGTEMGAVLPESTAVTPSHVIRRLITSLVQRVNLVTFHQSTWQICCST